MLVLERLKYGKEIFYWKKCRIKWKTFQSKRTPELADQKSYHVSETKTKPEINEE